MVCLIASSMDTAYPPATSVPSPTFRPPSSSVRTGQHPLLSEKLLFAQWAMPVPHFAIISTSDGLR